MNLRDKLLKEIQRLINRVKAALNLVTLQDITQTQNPSDTPPTSGANGSSQEQSIIVEVTIKSFGSPNCSNAKEDPNTQIKDLKISSNGLSYQWAKGNLRNWGIQNDHDASALAVAGYGDGRVFKCSKFDWISSDRLTRSFENIEDHYNGFDPQAFHQAKHRCFFIMSKDGSKRTNILVA